MNKYVEKKIWKFCCWYLFLGWGIVGYVSKWVSSNGIE